MYLQMLKMIHRFPRTVYISIFSEAAGAASAVSEETRSLTRRIYRVSEQGAIYGDA